MRSNNKSITEKKQLMIGFILLLICILLRIMDIFVLRLDELIGEIIVSKFLGFLVIILCLRFTGRRLRDIGLHTERIGDSFKWGIMLVFLALVFSYSTQYLFLLFNNASPILAWNEYTLPKLVLFVLIGNVINSLMEEGLFRGVILKDLMQHRSFWFANVLQAMLFGLWHIIWPIKLYSTGQISIGGAVMNALIYTIFSGIMGFLMGYLFYKTSDLWISISWHTVWNSCLNLLTVQSAVLSNENALISKSTNMFWVAFTIAVIISMLLICKIKPERAN